MKVKMMALVLAVGLGVTGVAATAQAKALEAYSHEHQWNYEKEAVYYMEYSNFNHYKVTVTPKWCLCGATDSDTEKDLEDHTLTIAPTGAGYLWECTDCGYTE